MSKEHSAKPRSFYSSIFLAAALYVFISTFSILSPILFSFILMVLLSLALNPLVMKLRRLSGGRTVATGFVVLIFLAVLVLTSWAFYNPIQRSMKKFADRLPQYWERIQRPILKMEQKAVISEKRIKREVSSEVAHENKLKKQTNAPAVSPSPPPLPEPEPPEEKTPPSEGIMHSAPGMILGGIGGSFKGIASNAASIGLVVVTVFFGVIFTLLHPRPVIRTFYEIVPEQHHRKAAVIARRIVEFVPRWALATLIGMTIIGFMTFFATWPLVGFQDALVLGLIALVFEAVPYIGPILAAVPALLLAAGQGGWLPLWVLLAYITVQTLENNVIMPVVVGGQLQLHPVAVIFSMLICVTIFGVLGVLIALPMLAIFNILHEEIYRPYFLPNVSDEELEKMATTTLDGVHFSAKKSEPADASDDQNPGHK